MRPGVRFALLAIAAVYSVVHIITSGILFAIRTPNVGQVIEELQPLFRLFTSGEATVDHARQYGPIFLFLFHPVYRFTLDDPVRLAWYAYALDWAAILIGFVATWDGIKTWARARGVEPSWSMLFALFLLWSNFSPLYGVLVIKNVELWELAALAVAGAALLRGRRGLAGWSVAAAALIKMLPLVFVPYLLVRDRRAFVHTIVALAVLLTLSQAVYGTAMGWGYLPSMINAASGGDAYGWTLGMTWHENVSIRGAAIKAFGFLTFPDYGIADPLNARGFFVRTWPGMDGTARMVGSVVWAIGVIWTGSALLRRRSRPEPGRTFWDWALVGIMMLVLAPQISQDYMVLTLVAFSYVMAGCMIYGGTAAWIQFAIAVLLVANVLPRGLFSRLILIDPMMAWSGYTHLTRAEAYQYFCFPLLGLLVLARVWMRLSDADDAAAEAAPAAASSSAHRI